jgi:thiol-disulfide isomerase/thioredoxin
MIHRILTLVVLALLSGAATADTPPQPFVKGSWGEILRAHAGRPTLIHFWGLTCGPCWVEMPHLARLAAANPGLDVVLVHADFLPGDPAMVTQALGKWGLGRLESWYFAEAVPERARFEVDPNWIGEIPRTTLVAADGSRQVIVGPINATTVQGWLRQR